MNRALHVLARQPVVAELAVGEGSKARSTPGPRPWLPPAPHVAPATPLQVNPFSFHGEPALAAVFHQSEPYLSFVPLPWGCPWPLQLKS